MSAALAAVGAVIAALIEFTIASRFQIAGAQLHILFVFAVIVTVAAGFEDGMAWAFFGGLTADLLTRPLGSTVFALLLAVGAAAVMGRFLTKNYWLGPVAAVFVLSFVYLIVLHVVSNLLQPPSTPMAFGRLPIDAAVNAAFAALVVPPFALWRRRIALRERVVW